MQEANDDQENLKYKSAIASVTHELEAKKLHRYNAQRPNANYTDQ